MTERTAYEVNDEGERWQAREGGSLLLLAEVRRGFERLRCDVVYACPPIDVVRAQVALDALEMTAKTPAERPAGPVAPKRAAVDALMKRCQIGVGGRHALDNAHDVMAECYGTLGALMLTVERLRGRLLEMEAAHERGAGTVQTMQQALQEADNIMGHEDEHTAWRERWQTLWPWSGGPNGRVQPAPPAKEMQDDH